MAEGCYTSKRGETLPISLKAACTYDADGGSFTMVHELCTAAIKDDGKAIAEVGGMIGGGIQIHDLRDGSVWQLTALDLFNALNQARSFAAYERARAKYHGGKKV